MESALDRLLDRYDAGRLTRRELLGALAAFGAAPGAARSTAPPAVAEVNHVTLRVRDVDRSQAFYQRLLGLRLLKQAPDYRYLDAGRGFLALWQAGEAGVGFDHWCVGLRGLDRGAAMERLRREGYALRRDADAPETVYVLDPDGFAVQLESAGFKG
jgi:catechol 2,3-dioxygenase-like lactoylglutathione lyase family enzyme